ncbi:ArsR family transcriptional regulator [Massilia sp. UYP11]|uniref:ArsR/SmtB family transcription factor n=1 Tax=Massilia sp. UYP11 TaxID=1756385 RepID=UPI003D235778
MDTKHVLKALAALAQESRLAIFRLLVQTGPAGLYASKIGEALQISSSALSFHLKELSHANLVEARQEGRFVVYTAQFETMNALVGFLTENCCAGEACDVPGQACSPGERVAESAGAHGKCG